MQQMVSVGLPEALIQNHNVQASWYTEQLGTSRVLEHPVHEQKTLILCWRVEALVCIAISVNQPWHTG
jgi:hypothetical protein